METVTKITGKDLMKIGFTQGKVIKVAMDVVNEYYKDYDIDDISLILGKVLAEPGGYLAYFPLNLIAEELVPKVKPSNHVELNEKGVPYTVFGKDNIEQGAFDQMEMACKLPVSVAGAMMPDSHQGYGLNIGGVLATSNAVIPYGVGVDIGCRMCLSIFSDPVERLRDKQYEFEKALTKNTMFGTGREFSNNADHEVISRKEFDEIDLLKNMRKKALNQLGTSGSGNHFVEFGIVEITDLTNELGVAPGKYIGLLSHSGSRGIGAMIANHYTKIAMEKCILPKEAKHLAWLSLDSQEGMEYWLAMNLAGDYASACHHRIHENVSGSLGLSTLKMVENHHNFAWKEMYNGNEVIVHRKGATPAAKGVLGIIPGSMTMPGFIVSGKGNESSINSTSHGAGRLMSRTKAFDTITHEMMKESLAKHGVKLFGGGLDEAPQAYKDIDMVMEEQKDLVNVLGKFYPKVVKMADARDEPKFGKKKKSVSDGE